MPRTYDWILTKPLLWLTLSEFKEMGEYSTTLPTGKTIGKRWKRQIYVGPFRGRWVVGEYVKDPDPKYVGIKWYRVACAGDFIPEIHDPKQPWRRPTFSASMREAYASPGF